MVSTKERRGRGRPSFKPFDNPSLFALKTTKASYSDESNILKDSYPVGTQHLPEEPLCPKGRFSERVTDSAVVKAKQSHLDKFLTPSPSTSLMIA